VRIALNLKGLNASRRRSTAPRRRERASAAYRAINPQALVPALEDGGRVLTQSLAIIEYLEERYPQPPLLPKDPADRAAVRAMALVLACEVHPIQNLRVLNYFKSEFQQSDEAANRWAKHWIGLGLAALEEMAAASRRGRFSFGNAPTLADVCLVPQLSNARRFGCDLAAHPTLIRIDAACAALPAFASRAGKSAGRGINQEDRDGV
jgi:maleylpyruvate isomerase